MPEKATHGCAVACGALLCRARLFCYGAGSIGGGSIGGGSTGGGSTGGGGSIGGGSTGGIVGVGVGVGDGVGVGVGVDVGVGLGRGVGADDAGTCGVGACPVGVCGVCACENTGRCVATRLGIGEGTHGEGVGVSESGIAGEPAAVSGMTMVGVCVGATVIEGPAGEGTITRVNSRGAGDRVAAATLPTAMRLTTTAAATACGISVRGSRGAVRKPTNPDARLGRSGTPVDVGTRTDAGRGADVGRCADTTAGERPPAAADAEEGVGAEGVGTEDGAEDDVGAMVEVGAGSGIRGEKSAGVVVDVSTGSAGAGVGGSVAAVGGASAAVGVAVAAVEVAVAARPPATGAIAAPVGRAFARDTRSNCSGSPCRGVASTSGRAGSEPVVAEGMDSVCCDAGVSDARSTDERGVDVGRAGVR